MGCKGWKKVGEGVKGHSQALICRTGHTGVPFPQTAKWHKYKNDKLCL